MAPPTTAQEVELQKLKMIYIEREYALVEAEVFKKKAEDIISLCEQTSGDGFLDQIVGAILACTAEKTDEE